MDIKCKCGRYFEKRNWNHKICDYCAWNIFRKNTEYQKIAWKEIKKDYGEYDAGRLLTLMRKGYTLIQAKKYL